jgi:hypothetical protein
MAQARIIDQLLQSWVFDVLSSEKWVDKTNWTSHPVESGIEISDHAIQLPTSLSLMGIVSDSPLPPELPLPLRARWAYERLLTLKNLGQTVTVVTGLRVLQDMGITSVSLMRDRKTGNAIAPRVDLKQIRIVASITVPIPPALLLAAAGDAASKADAGTQSAAASASTAPAKTLAKTLTTGLGGTDVAGLVIGGG